MTKKSDAPAIRFKGFSDAWEQRKFDEVFDCTVPNNTLSRAELSYDEGTVLNVHYGDVLIKYGSVLDVQKDDIPRIPHRCREDFNGALLQDGDVIIADTAEDETTGKACEIGNLQGSAIVSGLHTMVCRPRNRMALGYLGYYLNSNAYHHQLLPLMQGIKVLSLSRSNIQKTSVSYPIAVKEQQLIAYYFSQLDNLITLHQRKCISFTGRAGRLISTVNKKRITSSWEQRKFDEVFDCTVPNNTLSRAELSYDEGTVLNVHYGDVLIKYGSVLDVQKDDIPRIPHRCREDFNGALLQDGDVIIADTAEDETTGKACEIGNLQGSAIVSGLHTMVCRPRNRMALGYLGYYLNSNAYHHQLLPLMQGIKVLSLSRSNIQKTSVSYPSAMKEQQLIASYFSQLDHLITLHQCKCQIDGCRFQSPLAITWEQRKVTEIGKIYIGLVTTMTKHYTDEGTLLIRNSDIKDGKFEFGDNPIYLEKTFAEKNETRMHQIGDVITVHTGDVGTSAVITENEAKSIGFATIVTRPNPKIIDSNYLCSFLNTDKHKKWAVSISTGDGRTNYNLGDYFELVVPVPSIAEQKKIASYIQKLNRLITLHQCE